MSGWYFSFADGNRPKGQQFLGGCFIVMDDGEHLPIPEFAKGKGHDDLAQAITMTHLLGINPGGEVKAVGPMPNFGASFMAEWGNRLLTREEVESCPDPMGDE